MAKQAQLSKTEPAKRTRTSRSRQAATEPETGESQPANDEKPAVALVPEEPAEPKRRGRPPASKTNGKRGRKAKAAKPAILSMVETEEGTGQFEPQTVNTVAELLDLMDENRKVTITREWREF